MKSTQIIAAVRNGRELEEALNSDVGTVFMLSSNIEELGAQTEAAHKAGKKIYVHIDLSDGIGKDEYGVRFVKSLGVDGIISTRTNMIKIARKEGMMTVQRFFMVDSHSVDTSLEALRSSKPHMIEIMPGTLTKVIKRLKAELDIPIVAGGLIETCEEIDEALSAGAFAVSIGKSDFWS